jgi:hypothetical protein
MWNWLKSVIEAEAPVVFPKEIEINGSGHITATVERLDRNFKLHLSGTADLGKGQIANFNIIIDDNETLIGLSALLANACQRLDSPYYSAEDLGPLWEDEHPDVVEDVKDLMPDCWMEWLTSPNLRFGGETPLKIIQQGKAYWVREVIRSVKLGVFS